MDIKTIVNQKKDLSIVLAVYSILALTLITFSSTMLEETGLPTYPLLTTMPLETGTI
jgi:hypothetical protein